MPKLAVSPQDTMKSMLLTSTSVDPDATFAVTITLLMSVPSLPLTIMLIIDIFPEISFLVSSLVDSAFCCSSSAVLMMIVEATAATRIRAMKTIIAPIPMEPSSWFLSTVWLYSLMRVHP